MTVTDPTGTDADGGAGRSGSRDEAPTFTTSQHLEYLVGLTINEWKKTMTKLHNMSADVATMPQVDEMAFYNPEEDSVIKFRVGKVPEVIHRKVDALQQMQHIGLPHLPALVELVKKELAKYPLSTGSDEDGDGNNTSFAGMLVELAKNRLFAEYFEEKETGFNLTVVFVDESGRMRLKQCRLQHDANFASFLALMDDYPQEFNLNVEWAASFWDSKIRELKKKGYDGHPKLVEIEQLIATHKATSYDDGPKWLFFKTNQRIAYAKAIENEHDLKKIVDIVTNPAKNNQLACMVRAVDKDLIFVSDELKFFERKLLDSVNTSDETAPQHPPADPGHQQPDADLAPRIDSFTSDDFSFDLLARTLGVGFNWPFLNDDDDDEEEETRKLPWSLMEDIEKS